MTTREIHAADERQRPRSRALRLLIAVLDSYFLSVEQRHLPLAQSTAARRRG